VTTRSTPRPSDSTWRQKVEVARDEAGGTPEFRGVGGVDLELAQFAPSTAIRRMTELE
jgi:hypothetical protein